MSKFELVTVNDVEVLIEKVRIAHREAQEQAEKAKQYAKRAIDRALEAGDLLLLLKPTVKHGEWEAFLSERLPEISIRQAQKYMKIARELPAEKRTGALLTVNGALRMLEAPDELEAQPEVKEPWWSSQSPELNAVYCNDRDLFFAACAWMDTEGKSFDEIAECLGCEVKYVHAAIDPQIANLYTGFDQEDNSEIRTEMNLLWSTILQKAKSYTEKHLSSIYLQAANQAKLCNNELMEKQLLSISSTHKRRFERLKVETNDEFIDFMAGRLIDNAVNHNLLLPCAWLELGAAVNLFKRKFPNWLIQFNKATEVLTHVIMRQYEKLNSAT